MKHALYVLGRLEKPIKDRKSLRQIFTFLKVYTKVVSKIFENFDFLMSYNLTYLEIFHT